MKPAPLSLPARNLLVLIAGGKAPPPRCYTSEQKRAARTLSGRGLIRVDFPRFDFVTTAAGEAWLATEAAEAET